MRNLFIIGNGFDLHHGLSTSYRCFYDYLKENNDFIFRMTCGLFIDQFDKDDRLWSDFETEMSDFNYCVFTAYRDEICQEGRPLKFEEFHTIESDVIAWKRELDKAFKAWIISSLKDVKPIARSFGVDDLFLNFNYTDTLTRIYGVDRNRVLYIHNSINDKELIYGHGFPFHYKKLIALYERAGVETDDIFFRDVKIMCKVGNLLRKNVRHIINSHSDFIKSVSEVGNVIVIGHSMSDVDLPYFRWILKNVPLETKWIISYYNDSIGVIKQIKKLRIKNYELCTTNQILNDFTDEILPASVRNAGFAG